MSVPTGGEKRQESEDLLMERIPRNLTKRILLR
jgi:hypothetical protein